MTMIPEARNVLLKLIRGYSYSLDRVHEEKNLMNALEARAVTEAGLDAKDFKKVATAYWKFQQQEKK